MFKELKDMFKNLFQKNVALAKPLKVSGWRKSAVGTYGAPKDGEVYCLQSINIEPALKFIESLSFENEKITLTHLAGKAAGLMIEKYPQINRMIRFGSFYQREDISIFFQVAADDKGEELSGHTVRNIHKLPVSDVAKDLSKVAKKIKAGNDVNYQKVKKTMNIIPAFFVSFFIKIYGGVLYSLNLWSPLFGTPKDSFGSMMITNIGTLGMQTAFVPLVPFSRCPLILALGEVYEKAVVKEGQVVVQKTIDCCWTLDHRIIDGVIGAKMAKYFEHLMQHPQSIHS